MSRPIIAIIRRTPIATIARGLHVSLADIGVALLLFAVGLEFSLGKLRLVAAVAVGGTALQLGLSVAMGWPQAHWWG